MKGTRVFILLLILNSFYFISEAQDVEGPLKKGIERIIRSGNNWSWGTKGHGSFDDAAHLFKADSDVVYYNIDETVYRVFTRNKVNYVELNTHTIGGIYTYTTKSTLDSFPSEGLKTKQRKIPFLPQPPEAKVIRIPGQWEWGTFDHGSFDQAVKILKEEDNVLNFMDATNPRIKYRVFSHTTLNYVEIDYGWRPGGVFTYTTRRE